MHKEEDRKATGSGMAVFADLAAVATVLLLLQFVDVAIDVLPTAELGRTSGLFDHIRVWSLYMVAAMAILVAARDVTLVFARRMRKRKDDEEPDTEEGKTS